jgi:hypothetical protein
MRFMFIRRADPATEAGTPLKDVADDRLEDLTQEQS